MDIMKLVSVIRPDKTLPELPKEWTSAPAMKVELEKAGFRDVNSEDVQVEMSFDRYEPFLDLLTTKMPMMINLVKDFSQGEMERLRQLMLEKTKEMAPSEPGILYGAALVATGRK